MLDRVTLPAAIMVATAIVGVVILGVAHADPRIIFDLLILLGIGGLGGAVSTLRFHINGNVTELTRLLSKALDQLGHSQPVPTPKDGGDQ